MDTFSFFPFFHREQNCIGIRFSKEDPRNELIRKIKGIRWSATNRCWYGPDTNEFKTELNRLVDNMESETKSGEMEQEILSEEKLKGIEKLKSWMQSKRYSENTVKVYTGAMLVFLRFFPEKFTANITLDDIIRFNNDYLLKKDLSTSYQNQMVNAIKLFYKVIENRNIEIGSIHRPRPEHKLPNLLSLEEMKKLLEALTNLKHRAMLSLIYACGLRRGELLNLKPTDIDSTRNVLLVRNSKGKKDRIVPIGTKIIELLRDYYKAYQPKVWLFEGQVPGEQYGERSIQLVIKQAAAKAGIKRTPTLHWLRHSFATHLMDSGTDSVIIKELLGHASIKTTQIYMHVSTRNLKNFRSPFDDL